MPFFGNGAIISLGGGAVQVNSNGSVDVNLAAAQTFDVMTGDKTNDTVMARFGESDGAGGFTELVTFDMTNPVLGSPAHAGGVRLNTVGDATFLHIFRFQYGWAFAAGGGTDIEDQVEFFSNYGFSIRTYNSATYPGRLALQNPNDNGTGLWFRGEAGNEATGNAGIGGEIGTNLTAGADYLAFSMGAWDGSATHYFRMIEGVGLGMRQIYGYNVYHNGGNAATPFATAVGKVYQGNIDGTPTILLTGGGEGRAVGVIAATAATKGLVIMGAASQTANLQEWQNSAGAIQLAVMPAGNLYKTTQLDLYSSGGAAQGIRVASIEVNSTYGTAPPTNGIYTLGNIAMGTAASTITPGATSFAIRNAANTANNLLIKDAGYFGFGNTTPDYSATTWQAFDHLAFTIGSGNNWQHIYFGAAGAATVQAGSTSARVTNVLIVAPNITLADGTAHVTTAATLTLLTAPTQGTSNYNLYVAAGNNLLGGALVATANSGRLSLGNGPFDGSTAGYFVGSASGTQLAVNAASGFAGGLLDFQIAGVRKLVMTAGNLGLGAIAAFGTSADAVLGLFNGTEPSTSPADMVQLYSVDLSAGNATLGLRTETAVAVEALADSTHTLQVRVNGATYKMMLVAV